MHVWSTVLKTLNMSLKHKFHERLEIIHAKTKQPVDSLTTALRRA
ncbi:hypothetical protein E1A91_A04G090400v1 [Gossypium mustelinum]|uniref:Uncharacterized protein n=1 Tax=Gossypium mustelinum TaxID=34275 RepID=A0A5D2ZM89_GOSMU|nr:hypothetical protein E1A91_A04G090400v1 [Gossypium mustelinum]